MLVLGFLNNNEPCDIDNVCEVTGLTREEVLSLDSIRVLDEESIIVPREEIIHCKDGNCNETWDEEIPDCKCGWVELDKCKNFLNL